MGVPKKPLLTEARRVLARRPGAHYRRRGTSRRGGGPWATVQHHLSGHHCRFCGGLSSARVGMSRGNDVLQWDEAISRAVQHVTLPAVGWVLIRASDLGYFPMNVIVYAGVCVPVRPPLSP